jgi:phage gp29-like protein
MSKHRRHIKAADKPPPIPAQPTGPESGQVAPWPHIDRYPVVLGSSLTLSYLAAVYRTAQTGYRREYVDCLDELLERDPHAYCCYSTRILTVASSRISCPPANCDKSEAELAKEIATEFEADLLGIDNLRQSLAALLWACYYGVQASEIEWKQDGERIKPAQLWWIHSRRIAYPDPNSWAPHIWDLGAVNGWGFLSSPTAITMTSWGIKPSDYPNKFIFHSPQYRGDYPTRDGVGRETAIWSALKTMGARQASQYIERFSKPWVIGNFATSDDGKPRKASDDGILKGEAAVRGLGAGNVSSCMLEDGIKIQLSGPGASSSSTGSLVHGDFIKICDNQTSKAVLGNSDSVEAGPNGSRASTSERTKGQRSIYKYDAACLGDTLKRDLAMAWMRINRPGLERLCPGVTIHIEEELTPQEVMEMAKDGASIGMPVDADKLSRKTGVEVIAADATEGRRCLPVKPIENLSALDIAAVDIEPPPPPSSAPPIKQEAETVTPTNLEGEEENQHG